MAERAEIQAHVAFPQIADQGRVRLVLRHLGELGFDIHVVSVRCLFQRYGARQRCRNDIAGDVERAGDNWGDRGCGEQLLERRQIMRALGGRVRIGNILREHALPLVDPFQPPLRQCK